MLEAKRRLRGGRILKKAGAPFQGDGRAKRVALRAQAAGEQVHHSKQG